MADPLADKVTPDTVVQVSANLDAYISQRADLRAEAALARVRTEANEKVRSIQTRLDYERDVVRELRRQLGDALQRPTRAEWNAVVQERDDAQAEADAERASNDALRKNRDQLADELRVAREALAQYETVRSKAEQWARSGTVFVTVGRELLDIVGPVTVPEGTPLAMQACPHRDFDDPTRCLICHP